MTANVQLSLFDLPAAPWPEQAGDSRSSLGLPADRPASTPQLSFARMSGDPAWPERLPGHRRAPLLGERVRAQTRFYAAEGVATGHFVAESANTERKALECIAKQAERLLGRKLGDLAELYDKDLIAALARDDRSLEREDRQLARPTLRQRRGQPMRYLQIVGVPGLSFEQGCELIKQGFRAAAQRRGYRYVLGVGKPERYDPKPVPLEDVHHFFEAAAGQRRSFIGPRLSLAAAFSLFHGLRPVSVLGIRCEDFRRKGGRLFLEIQEKRCKGKRQRREFEVRPEVLPHLVRYLEAVNAYAGRSGWPQAPDLDSPGPLFVDERRKALAYQTLLLDYGEACRRANIRRFTARGLRHLHASGLASLLPMGPAAGAGGWDNDAVFGRHYAGSLKSWQPGLVMAKPPIELADFSPYGRAAKPLEVGDARRAV